MIAEWHNALQRLAAEETRWGIPVTLSTDPRHAFTHNPGTSMAAGPFSEWPEPLGLAALGDVARSASSPTSCDGSTSRSGSG